MSEQLPDIQEQMVDAKANFSDTEVLNHTKRIKLKLVDALTKDEVMPTDAKEVGTLLNVLDSLDRSALANIKQQNESDSNQAQREAIAIFAIMQKQARGRDPFIVEDNRQERVVTIEDTLVTNEFVPGELSNEKVELNYEDFVTDFENK